MDHRLVRFRDCQHLSTDRKVISDEAIRIPRAVEPLVMRPNDATCLGVETHGREQALCDRRVPPEGTPFRWDELTGDAHLLPIEEQLADVVQAGGVLEPDHVRRRHVHPFRDRARGGGNAA